ncbi:MAG: DHHA1 domain-containing protein, partial [Actinomycetota bacterium]|nr:DHHA1 domain-containing protein [Actinomycetota bacterium]
GSNIRRIEAVAGSASVHLLREQDSVLTESANLLGVPTVNLIDSLEKKLREIQELKSEIDGLRETASNQHIRELVESANDGIIVQQLDGVRRDEIRDLVMGLRVMPEIKIVVVGAITDNGGAAIAAGVSEEVSANAGDLLTEAAKIIKGGGGKGEKFAMIGGKDPQALPKALDSIHDLLEDF